MEASWISDNTLIYVHTFDIGGTKMRIALSRDGVSFDTPVIVSTPKDFEEGMTVLKRQLRD